MDPAANQLLFCLVPLFTVAHCAIPSTPDLLGAGAGGSLIAPVRQSLLPRRFRVRSIIIQFRLLRANFRPRKQNPGKRKGCEVSKPKRGMIPSGSFFALFFVNWVRYGMFSLSDGFIVSRGYLEHKEYFSLMTPK